MLRRTSRTRAYAPDPGAPGHCCEVPGCQSAGEYRAPKARDALRQYWWFCLAHVRAYNSRWDFYKGMSPAEIELQMRADTAWQRPSWPLGRLGGRAYNEDEILDPLDLLGRRKGATPPDRIRSPAELREPLAVMGLGWPVTLPDVKTRYKELAKRHHPDANGGDREAEEKLKTINLAYAALRRNLQGEKLAQTG